MAYRDVVLTDTPVSFYEMETGTGTDSGSGARTLTLVGGITTGVTGIIGSGWTFDGVNDKATMPSFPTLTNAYSMEAWIKAPSAQGMTGDYHTIVRRDGTDIVLMRVRGSNIVGNVNPGQLEVFIDGTTLTSGSSYRVDDGQWHHIVYTQAGNAAKLYIDGVQRATATTSQTTFNFGTAGGAIGSDNAGTGEFFKGTMDNVAIYNVALSATRVTAHYNAAYVAGGYTGQVMTASAAMPEPRVNNRLVLAVTEDAQVQGNSTNYGQDAVVGGSANTYLKIPGYTPTSEEVLTKVELVLTPLATDASDDLGIAPITSSWSESTITGVNLPTVGSISGRTVSWTAGQPTAIDLEGISTTNGVRISATDVAIHSSEATTEAYRPYVVYTLTPVASAGHSASPVTASAVMPDATVSTSSDVSVGSTVLTASADVVSPSVTADSNVSISAEPAYAVAGLSSGSGFALTASFSANPMTAEAEVLDGLIETTQGVVFTAVPIRAEATLRQPALVNGSPIAINEAEDKYFALVMADVPKTWLRLADNGSVAVDRKGGQGGLYNGVLVNQGDGPDGRHSVHFDGTASIEQLEANPDEVLQVTDVIRSTLEFSFKTSQGNTFLMAGKDSVNAGLATTANPAREVTLKNGKISYKTYYYPNSLGQTQDPTEFSGFRNLADGEWHHVVIKGGTYRFGEYGVEIYVDGKFEVRRVSANAFSGFPDWIGSRPSAIDGYEMGALPSSQNFVGDMSEIAFYDHINVDETDIARHYYAFMGWKPIEAQPVEAFAFMTGGNTAKGNQKRALYLWWSPETDAYNVGGGSFTDKMNFDPLLGNAKGNVNGVYDYEGYKVFTRGVAQGPGYTYRDEATDAPSLIDLTRHVTLEDYDVIMFGDWPDEGSEIDYWESLEPGGRERLISQLRDANDAGIGLMVTHPRLAVDLGIVDRVELVPTLRESRFATGQGGATGLYDYGSAYDFPWNIAGNAGLNQVGVIGSEFNGVAVNRSQSFLESKAFFYGDTHKNDRFRVRALIEGLTDIPSYMISNAVYFREYDIYGWNDIAYKYIHRLDGLQIGDEYLFHGSDFGQTYEAISADLTDARAGRWQGTFATPLANVKAGTVVTTFGASQYVGTQQVDNPYSNYATTIVLREGDVLAGRPVVGKIFVNFSEQPNRHTNAVVVQKVPNDADLPLTYKPETAEQKTWEYSFTRKSLRSSSPSAGESVSVVGPNGQVITVNVSGAGSNLAMTRSSNIFPLEAKPSFQMVPRGFMWLQERTETVPGSVQVSGTPMAATAELASPAVVAQRDVSVSASALAALAVMPKVAEDQSGDVDVYTLPMTASTTFTGYSRVVQAQPMTATAVLVENFDAVHTSGEQIVLTLHGRDITLFMEEN